MKNIAVLVISLVLALGVTIPKLYKMCQIKGWLPGASATQETITQKWHQAAAENPLSRDSYWIAWSAEDIHKVGDHRTNVMPEDWVRLYVGDQIEIVRLSGDRSPYLRDDIFVSAGNFAFDGIFLAAQIGVALTMLMRMIQSRNRTTDAM